MDYYISKTIDGNFEETIDKVTELLKEQEFGIITEINVSETLKNKLGVDFKKYRILGACNPGFAYKALQTEDLLGVMLPCNVIVIEQDNGKIEVAAMDAANTMSIIGNPDLSTIAEQVSERLNKVISAL